MYCSTCIQSTMPVSEQGFKKYISYVRYQPVHMINYKMSAARCLPLRWLSVGLFNSEGTTYSWITVGLFNSEGTTYS